MSWIERPRPSPGVTIAAEGPDRGSLEARASLVFKIMAVVGWFGIILSLVPDSFPNSALLTVAFNLAAGLISGLYFIVAQGLDRSRPWARAATRPMLVLLGAWGAYAAVAGFSQGIVRIPFELALAVWAFLGDRAHIPTPRPVARTFGVIAATIPLLGVMAFGYLVFGWGGALDVDDEDLVASLQVDCGDPGAAPPAEVAVSYDWTWSSSAPLPNEVDSVFIGWTGDDAEGRPLYIFRQSLTTDPTIRPGQRGELGLSLLEAARESSAAGFSWAIDLNRRGYQPGQIDMTLRLAPENPTGALSLTVRASYVHLGIWREEATTVSCTW
jgi:hypothetical protein